MRAWKARRHFYPSRYRLWYKNKSAGNGSISRHSRWQLLSDTICSGAFFRPSTDAKRDCRRTDNRPGDPFDRSQAGGWQDVDERIRPTNSPAVADRYRNRGRWIYLYEALVGNVPGDETMPLLLLTGHSVPSDYPSILIPRHLGVSAYPGLLTTG